MAILIDQDTRLIIQGLTGRAARMHLGLMRELGTRVVAGVTPGRGGSEVDGVPVFDTVAEAVERSGGNTAMQILPPAAVRDGLLEALDAEVPLVVCVSEGAPQHDLLLVLERLRQSAGRSRLIGPNCPGLVSPGRSKVGMMPNSISVRGPIGVVSRSGTLSYEVCYHLVRLGLGQSTWVGVGGDPLKGCDFAALLPLFAADPETRVVVLLGEIGGTDEERAAELIAAGYPKPVVALVAGRSAPPGRQMGHAGALVSGGRGSWEGKVAALRAAGALVASTPAEAAHLAAQALG
jgi:succinyl-CoA synthetase alpha subunit